MLRLSVNQLTTNRWSFETDVDRYVSAGIPGIGVWRHKLSDYGERKGAELLAERGLHVSGLFWAGGFTGSDGRSAEDSVDDALDAIRLAADLSAGCLVVHSGPRWGHTTRHCRRLVLQAFDKLVPAAEAAGVTLAVEPMLPCLARDWTILDSLEAGISFVDEYHTSRVQLVFDTYQWGWDSAVFEVLPSVANRLALVQLGDGKHPPQHEPNRCRLCDGVLPLQSMLEALSSAGYDGYCDVELMGEETEMFEYHELLDHSKQAFSQLTGCPVA